MSGTKDYQWFGFDALCVDKTFIVSSPGHRTPEGLQAAGAVHGYDIADKSLKFALESTEDQSKFGYSLSYNAQRKMLAVGAPSRKNKMIYHSGAVYIYDLTKPNLTFANHKSVIISSDRGARFGR